jgi:imidazolonepropionase-like amidohydrolase
MRRAISLLVLLGFALLPSPVPAQRPEQQYIRAGKLLDVHSGHVLTGMIVVVDGDRIEHVAKASEITIPARAKVIDLSNAFVLPGLIDAHEHVFLTGEDNGRYDEQLLKESWQFRTIEAIVNAKKDLDAGFTSMRDCETEGAMYGDVDVKTAIERGLIPGPRLEAATRAMSTTGGYPLEGYSPNATVPSGVIIADGVEGVRKAVREQIKYGADFIKVYGTHKFYFQDGKMISVPTFTMDELKAIVDEAHTEGRKVACHGYGDPGLHNCIVAGVDSIEHGLDISDDDMREMKARGTWLVPTLYVYKTIEKDDLQQSGGTVSRASVHEISFKKALAAGIKIAFGTDAGPFPHGTQAIEFEYMVQYGMTPLAAIQSATLKAAELMDSAQDKWSKEVGAIDQDKLADIIAVSGNPLEDVKQLEQVKFVMKGGVVYKNEFAIPPIDKLAP